MSLSVTMLMERGKDAVAGGPRRLGASGWLPFPDPIEPDSDGGMVVENLPVWANRRLCRNKGRAERAMHKQAALLY